ncbi:MAG: FGLLP motif-containing membrane protein [Actinomycetota bacterium]
MAPVLIFSLLFLAPSLPARAVSSLSFPSPIRVGDLGAVTVVITNSTPVPQVLNSFLLLLSCGSTSIVCLFHADPGVFEVEGVISGSGACPTEFLAIQTNPLNGLLTFLPDSLVVLTAGGTCSVDFNVRALKMPALDSSSAPGIQTAQSLVTTSLGSNLGISASMATVEPAQPQLSSDAAGNSIGQAISDSVTLSEGVDETGVITFSLFGPADSGCAGPPIASSLRNVSGNGVYTSDPFVPNEMGDFRWIASYSGDVNNLPVSTMCNDPGSLSEVVQAAPTITVSAESAPIGNPVSAIANLSDGFIATGSLTLSVYDSSDPTCSAPPAATTTLTVAGDGLYPSDPFLAEGVGEYRWTADYSGDGLNLGASSVCAATSSISKATPVLSPGQASDATLGGSISDAVTLSDGFSPGGEVVFTVYGPDDSGCTGAVAFVSTVAVSGNGVYVSSSFAPAAEGTYGWTISYAGDANNLPASTPCGAPGQTSVVTQPPTTTSTTTTLPPTTTSVPTSTTAASVPTVPQLAIPASATEPLPTIAAPTSTSTPITTVPLEPSSEPPVSASRDAASVETAIPATTTSRGLPSPSPETEAEAEAEAETIPAGLPPSKPPNPAAPGPILLLSSLDNVDAKPGGMLKLRGVGYRDCGEVFFFYDGVRLGSVRPDSSGNFRTQEMELPGDASPGRHTLATSCSESGTPVLARAVIQVGDATLHRSSVMTGIPRPSEVDLSPRSLATSALVSILLALLIAFPGALLDNTLDEHYAEIRGWFGLGPRKKAGKESPSRFRRSLSMFAFLLAGATAGAFLDPGFGFNGSTLALGVGLVGTLLILSLGLSIPSILYMRRRHNDRGRFEFLPSALLLTVFLVCVSKFLDLQPGYLYGVLGGFAFATELNNRTDARMSIIASAFALLFSLTAWFVWVPISIAASAPDAGFWNYVFEVALGGAFVAGLEGVIIGLLPISSMDGGTIKGWSSTQWAMVYGLATYIFVLVLMRPGSQYGADPTAMNVKTIAFAACFAAFSLGLWSYFRFRKEPEIGGAAAEN